MFSRKAPVPAFDLADYGDFVSVGGLSIHVWQGGKEHSDSVPVILVHGFGANNWCWRFMLKELSARHPVYAPDLPGFGLSDKPEEFDYTLSGYARFIDSFMDAVGIESAVLVGNSMGGGVAITTALAHPGRVKKLVLIDSIGYDKRGSRVYRFLGLPVIRDMIAELTSPAMLRVLLKRRVYHNPSAVTEELVRRFFVAYRTKNGKRSPLWVYQGFAPFPTIPKEEIEKIDVPTLIVWGQHDKILPAEHAGRFSQDIASSRTIIIPDAGHVPHEERPEMVNPLISDFIGEGD